LWNRTKMKQLSRNLFVQQLVTIIDEMAF